MTTRDKISKAVLDSWLYETITPFCICHSLLVGLFLPYLIVLQRVVWWRTEAQSHLVLPFWDEFLTPLASDVNNGHIRGIDSLVVRRKFVQLWHKFGVWVSAKVVDVVLEGCKEPASPSAL